MVMQTNSMIGVTHHCLLIPNASFWKGREFLRPARALSQGERGISFSRRKRDLHELMAPRRPPLSLCAKAEGVISEDAPTPGPIDMILWSDVQVRRRRKGLWEKSWNALEAGTAAVVLSMHLLCLFAPFTFSWNALWTAAGLYVLTGLLGITLSYHRNLAHRSFKLPKWLEYSFAYLGAQALQCGERDNVADLEKQPFYRFLRNSYLVHPIALALLLYKLGGFPYLVWGMGVRIVWVYHITWFVNSACHVWGRQAWNTGDLSRNNWWVALLAFGEGWHNNHHAFEYSARHGLEWWQIDITWYVVRLLQAMSLATEVRLPTRAHMEKMRLAS